MHRALTPHQARLLPPPAGVFWLHPVSRGHQPDGLRLWRLFQPAARWRRVLPAAHLRLPYHGAPPADPALCSRPQCTPASPLSLALALAQQLCAHAAVGHPCRVSVSECKWTTWPLLPALRSGGSLKPFRRTTLAAAGLCAQLRPAQARALQVRCGGLRPLCSVAALRVVPHSMDCCACLSCLPSRALLDSFRRQRAAALLRGSVVWQRGGRDRPVLYRLACRSTPEALRLRDSQATDIQKQARGSLRPGSVVALRPCTACPAPHAALQDVLGPLVGAAAGGCRSCCAACRGRGRVRNPRRLLGLAPP